MKVLILSCILLGLGACTAPITKDQLRKQPAQKSSFEVDKPYQQVFAGLLKQTRACYLNKPTVHQITVVGNRDNGEKTANITIEEVYAMAEHDAYLMIDLVSKGKNMTQVSVYASKTDAKNEVKSVKAWALQGSQQCDVSWLS
ncbi:MAG TPA: hypothetical protein ENK06_01865 [Gammaproteobacteria bacterium]|nr:hypothetical protein [Gammaproteobacteria bacterium]